MISISIPNPIDDGFIANSNSFAVKDSPITSETTDPMAILDRKLAPNTDIVHLLVVRFLIQGAHSFAPKSS